ncbi:MAG: glutaminase, partial [Oscillospiraceae bacterium]|nr:glutaminase [Oscillospiraceae bacterium]
LLVPLFSFEQILKFTRQLCLDDDICLDEAVYRSEERTGDRNRSIAYLLKSKEVLEGDALAACDLYFRLCSMSVNARSLAGLGLVLANGGVSPVTGERLLTAQVVRTVKTLMFTCGMYDGSGEFAVEVGLPAKSGVGGGIMSCVENQMGIGTYGPALDEKGNSIGGGSSLQYLSRALHLHMFDSGCNWLSFFFAHTPNGMLDDFANAIRKWLDSLSGEQQELAHSAYKKVFEAQKNKSEGEGD